MIIDSHAHIFPPMDGASGHATRREHLRYVQHTMMTHHQPVRRLDTGEMVTKQKLYDGVDVAIDAQYDRDFRGGDYGRFVWTVDGVDHAIQYFPPTLANLEATAEQMLAQMDYVGVQKAVIQSGHLYGRLNEHVAAAVAKYPDRFWGLAMVDEWRCDDSGQIRALDHAVRELGLHGLWFLSANLHLHRRNTMLDDPAFHPFWDHVRELGIPVFWFPTPGAPGRDLYLAELAAFDRWVRRYSEIPVVLTHGLMIGRFIEDGKVVVPEEAWKALVHPNVYVELVIPIMMGATWEYPFIEAQPIIRQYYERLGPDRLVWGSDMPNVERHCTYRQSLDHIRRHCDFIPAGDMDKILGGNVAKVMQAAR